MYDMHRYVYIIISMVMHLYLVNDRENTSISQWNPMEPMDTHEKAGHSAPMA